MLRSYSVIVPVLDKRHAIMRTLESIAASMAYFDENHPEAKRIRGEIVVVDDGSVDGTLELVRKFARGRGRVNLIQHKRSCGVGAARNTGVRMSEGQVLFFCDGDDLYFPEHLLVGFSVLDRAPNLADAEDQMRLLRAGNRGHVVLPSKDPVCAVRSGVFVKDTIHPYWQKAIDRTLPQNLCIRRECHEWGEGFPEEAVYRSIGGGEDISYNTWLNLFFRVGYVALKTVEYVRYPGNSFDRQIKKFQSPPDAGSATARQGEEEVFDIPLRRQEERIGYLLDKWLVLGLPALPDPMLNWEGVTRELVVRGRYPDAVRVAEDAARRGQGISAGLAKELARIRR